MNQFATPAPTTKPQIYQAKDAFDRLTFLGWRWGLTAVVAGLAASFFLFGYALVYWRNADMDCHGESTTPLPSMTASRSCFRPHRLHHHPVAKLWFRLLHALGLLVPGRCRPFRQRPTPRHSMPPWTSAVRADVVLSRLIATGCVLIFAGLVRIIVEGPGASR